MKRRKRAGADRKGSEGPPGQTDADAGLWRGRSIARRYVSEDGLTILVGRTAADNDILSLKLCAPRDFWLHIASGPGSHVVVRNPENLDRLPRATQQHAAALAARYSKAKKGGQTAVHLTRCSEVQKPRGFPPGKVTLGRYKTLQARPDAAE